MAEPRHAAGRHRGRRARWFGRGRTRALLSVGVLVGAGAVFTSATWSDRETVPGATFGTGALHIDLESNVRVRPESLTWSALDLDDLQDGGSRAAMMTVANNSLGAVPLSYRVRAAAPGALGGALRITVRRGGSVSAGTCTGGTTIGAAGTTLNGFDQPMDLHLPPGQAHQLCIQVTLPGGSNIAPSASSTVTLTFPARQEPS